MDLLELKKYINQNSISANITIGTILDDNCVGLFSTTGLKPTFYFDDTTSLRDGLQIISRHESYLEGEKILNDIFDLLNKLEGYEPQQSPFFIGRDEKGRAEFSVNYIITKEGAK